MLKYVKTFEDFQSITNTAMYDTGASGSFGRWKNENPALELEEEMEDIDKKTKIFIKKAKDIYGDKYTYSKTKIIDNNNPIIITCPKHGDFLTTPYGFISNTRECKECKAEFRKGKEFSKKIFKQELPKKPIRNNFVRSKELRNMDFFN